MAGFCKSASLEDIEKNGFVLTPGRFVGVRVDDASNQDTEKRIQESASRLVELSETSKSLDARIWASFKLIGIMPNDR